jgi:aryl-alcohol dehydrogenase-like predicted oxidoreductase
MEYVKLGTTGLEVSRICLGCMSYGDTSWQPWILSEEDAREHFRAAFEAGINFFDTADVYSRGRSEEITGRLLRDAGRRDEIVLATKVFFPLRTDGANRGGLSRKRILDACDASLRRLGFDYIDLYQIHRFDPLTPLDETLEALDSLVRSGKVRYLGASSMAAWQFAKALYSARERRWHPFVSMQNHYNLIYREEEREMIPLCTAEGVGIIPWSPLARGLLSGERTREEPEPTVRARTDAFGKKLYDSEGDLEVAEVNRRVAKRLGITPSQCALAWVLQARGVTAPIIGTTRVEHLREAVAALDVKLSPEDLAELEAPYRPHRVLGYQPPEAVGK